MAEYIEREAVMGQVKAIHNAVNTWDVDSAYDEGFHSATSQIQGLISYLPAADVLIMIEQLRIMMPEVTDDMIDLWTRSKMGRIRDLIGQAEEPDS